MSSNLEKIAQAGLFSLTTSCGQIHLPPLDIHRDVITHETGPLPEGLDEAILETQKRIAATLERDCAFLLGPPLVIDDSSISSPWGWKVFNTIELPSREDEKFPCIRETIDSINFDTTHGELNININTFTAEGREACPYFLGENPSCLRIEALENAERATWERTEQEIRNLLPESVQMTVKDVGFGKRSKTLLLTKNGKTVTIQITVPDEQVTRFIVTQGVMIRVFGANNVARQETMVFEDPLQATKIALEALE